MHYKRELQQCYNDEATKFSQTRQKHWHEFEHIVDQINSVEKNTIHIVELGCGDGRLYDYLIQHTNKKIHYTGIDFSKELLKIAQKKHPEATRICEDMVNGIKKLNQESSDIVISIAAFQHLPNKRERNFVLKNIYRILKYDGIYLMINRSLSKRFIQKYKQSIAIAISKYIFTLGQKARNDILIPRKGEKRVYHRYYHLFTLREISQLVQNNGFLIQTLGYIDNNGTLTQDKEYSRNSISINRKIIHD